jgi:class 3 adenylate cyclase
MVEEPQSETHKVVALMFTAIAVVGAHALQDEAQELELREEHGRLVRELLPRQGGREVKVMEDGFLLEFDRGLSAVRFGLALQQAVAERNRLAAPDRRLELRMGAHLGPVVHREGEVFGEGVNLAARIESLARPGALYVSEAVAREVEDHPLSYAVRLGRAELKKIRLPVAVFRVEPRAQSPRPALFARFRALFT